MSILIAESLEKKYRSKKVVNNLSFNIKSGEIIGLLGPNGAGKTTAFYMTVGLVSCSSGKITLDDLDITHYPIHKRAKIGIGYLPQEASVFRKLTVQENILAVLEMRKGLSQTKRVEILEKLLDQLHLNEIRNTIGMSLSGGERRRTEIARTLSIEPKFILLDEPFAGVDPISVLDIQGIIKSLASDGIGILITDHNVRETLGICDRGYIVNEGTSIAYGTPDQILENKQVKKVYLGESFRM
jgi:lipopolysaccharide export system ATP-binding protein